MAEDEWTFSVFFVQHISQKFSSSMNWTDKDARTVIQWHDFITTTAQTFDVESEIFF